MRPAALVVIAKGMQDAARRALACVTGIGDPLQFRFQPPQPLDAVAYVLQVVLGDGVDLVMRRRVVILQRRQRPDRVQRQAQVARMADETQPFQPGQIIACLLYTSDAADE